MTDGNTAIQVSPTEDTEMASIRQVFDKALNAIVDMTRLAKQVDELSHSVSALQGQVDHLRRQNEWLDETVAKLRDERSQLSAKLNEAMQNYATIKRDNDQLNSYNASLTAENDSLRASKHDAEQARDDAQLKIMELEDTIKGHVAKLDKFQSIAKELFPEPKPEPVPVEVVQTPTVSAGLSDAGSDSPYATPTPVNPETVPTRHYQGTQWSPGVIWDGEKQEYYTEN